MFLISVQGEAMQVILHQWLVSHPTRNKKQQYLAAYWCKFRWVTNHCTISYDLWDTAVFSFLLFLFDLSHTLTLPIPLWYLFYYIKPWLTKWGHCDSRHFCSRRNSTELTNETAYLCHEYWWGVITCYSYWDTYYENIT